MHLFVLGVLRVFVGSNNVIGVFYVLPIYLVKHELHGIDKNSYVPPIYLVKLELHGINKNSFALVMIYTFKYLKQK